MSWGAGFSSAAGVRAEDLHIPDHHGEEESTGPSHHHERGNEQAQWAVENVELTTVGIDIGSSTSHLMFAKVHLQRLAQALSSRFVIVGRQVLWRSPILLTPYLPDNSIDADSLAEFVTGAYVDAGLQRSEVDTGAVILTGEALKRRNARAIAELFAEEGGRFVCASAGHHLEALMAAHGSGAVALSRQSGQVVLNVDMGGGTSKFALCRDGEVLHTAAVAVGGRLVAREGRLVVRLEEPGRRAAGAARVDVELGEVLSEAEETRLVAAMAEVLVSLVNGGDGGELGRDLLVTEPWHMPVRPDILTFSGGVAEYLYGREHEDFGDLSFALAAAVRRALDDGALSVPVQEPQNGIRATVIGASQFSVQVSGNTVGISNDTLLPLQNLPVIHPRLDLGSDVDPVLVSAAVRIALTRFGIEDGDSPVAVALRWSGEPYYRRLRAVAEGVAAGMKAVLAQGHPLVVLVDGDVGQSLAHVLREDVGVTVPLVCLDGVTLQELDYVDIGELIRPSHVVPLVVKSLLFTAHGAAADEAEILTVPTRNSTG